MDKKIEEIYNKGKKAGFKDGVKAAAQIIKACESDPKDMTRISLLVNKKLEELIACD